MATVLITGVTGNVGSATLRALDRSKFNSIKVGVTSDEKGKRFEAMGFEYVVINFDDKESLVRAFRGVDRLVYIPAASQNRGQQGVNAVQAAKEAGVKFVIYFSVVAAEEKRILFQKQLAPGEEELKKSGLSYTILQSPWFQENILSFKESVTLPFRNGFTTAVSVDDLGRCIATVLANPEPHIGKTYVLTGPRKETGESIAKALSEAYGKIIKYHDISPEEAKKAFLAAGMPEWQVDGALELLEDYARGYYQLTNHVQEITGKPARSLLDTLKAHIRPEGTM